MPIARLVCDGSVLFGRTGPAGVGFVLDVPDGNQLRCGVTLDVIMTSTAAELVALIIGLDTALAEGITDIEAVTDDKTLVAQFEGVVGTRTRYGQRLLPRVKELAAEFDKFALRIGDEREVFESHTLARRAAKDAIRSELRPGTTWREDLISRYGGRSGGVGGSL